MSDGVELVCANCEKRGGLYEDVRVEGTAWREIKVTIVDGKQVVERHHLQEVSQQIEEIDVEQVGCSECNTKFNSIEEATAQVAHDYSCSECDWWGRQEWLHAIERPDCKGELDKGPPITPLPQATLEASK